MKSKILITGAAGYLGKVLFPLLEEKGFQVSGLDNFLYNQPLGKVQKGDICNLADMYKATKGIDTVVALAGIVGDPACDLDKKATKIVNQESTKMLVDVCETNKVKKIIFASTCSVYGYSTLPMVEESPTNPLSLYAQTKLESEKILLERCKSCEPLILRLGTMFGRSPRMRFDLVANIMTAMAVKEKQIVVNGGNQWRPLIHVRDVAEIISYFAGNNITEMNLIYNTAGKNYLLLEIAQAVSKITKAKIVQNDSFDGRDYHVASTNLPLQPKISLEQGIREMVGYFKKGFWQEYKDKIYYNVQILQNLRT